MFTIGGGGTCVDDTDCSSAVQYSRCVSGSCRCVSGFYATTDGLTCVRRRFGDDCNSESDCSLAFNNSLCRDGECQCQLGYEESPESTCMKLTIGGKCYNNTGCLVSIPHSVCDGSCKCDLGYKASADLRTCEQKIIGDECLSDHDCHTVVTDSECIYDPGEGINVCSCMTGYKVNTQNDQCTKRKLGKWWNKIYHVLVYYTYYSVE